MEVVSDTAACLPREPGLKVPATFLFGNLSPPSPSPSHEPFQVNVDVPGTYFCGVIINTNRERLDSLQLESTNRRAERQRALMTSLDVSIPSPARSSPEVQPLAFDFDLSPRRGKANNTKIKKKGARRDRIRDHIHPG